MSVAEQFEHRGKSYKKAKLDAKKLPIELDRVVHERGEIIATA